jgi:hypothetical protein
VQQHTIRTEAADGLNQLVNRGTAAVREVERGPLGVLSFELAPESLGALTGLLVEAELSQRGVGLQRLDVRAAGPVVLPLAEALTTALSQFGGTAYTNLVAKKDRELFDLTVSFPRARFGFYSEVTLLIDAGDAEARAACAAVLGPLGVAHKTQGATLVAARRQLRKPLATGAPLEAVQTLFERGLLAELYSARLPATRSVRLLSDGASLLDVYLSRGLASETPIAASDYVELQDFIRKYFEVEVGDKTWLVTNAHGTSEPGALGVIPPRPRTTWSVNWGTKRQM